MKLTIFVASGRTGQLLVKQALEAGYEITTYVRNANALNMQDINLKIVSGELSDKNKLREVITGANACISVLNRNTPSRAQLGGMFCVWGVAFKPYDVS